MTNYDKIGRRARVYLHNRQGIMIGSIEGRIADVAHKVPVGKDAAGDEIRKDLALIVDIDAGGAPFRNSAGEENEGWFAFQDIQILDDDSSHPLTDIRFAN